MDRMGDKSDALGPRPRLRGGQALRGDGDLRYSSLTPASFTTLPQRASSCTM